MTLPQVIMIKEFPSGTGLQMVVDTGTGHNAYVPGLAIGGKTGSVQVIAYHSRIKYTEQSFETRDHAWFTSFAPVDDPQVVVSVFIEHGGAGSVAAAPVAKGIYEEFARKHPELLRAQPIKTAVGGGG